MPFGYKEAGETLRAGGMGIVQSLLQESGRQKEEERLKEREKRQFELHLKGLDEAFERNKELAEYRAKLNAEYITFDNNIDMKNLYDQASLPDASAEIKGFVAGLEAIKFKQQNMVSLNEEDYAFKERLIGAGYEGISLWIDDRELKNARLIKQLESREKQYELLAGARLAEAERRIAEAKRKAGERQVKFRTKQKEEFEDIDKKIAGYKEKLEREIGKAKAEIAKEGLTAGEIGYEERPGKKIPIIGTQVKKPEEAKLEIREGEKPKGAALIEFYRNEIKKLEEQKTSILKQREREIRGTSTARMPEVETKTIIPLEIQLVMDELGISFEEAMRYEEERKKKYGIK